MAKTLSLPFDMSVITLAFSTAEAAATAFDCMTADMLQWHASSVYPSSADIKAALVDAGKKPATAAVYASAILKWARSGKTPANLYKCISTSPPNHVKSKAGRPAGKGAGKTTAVNSGAAADPLAPAANDSIIPKDGVSPMHRWAVALTAMDNGACIVRDANNGTMTAEDAVAFQAAVKVCKAIVGKYTAKVAAK